MNDEISLMRLIRGKREDVFNYFIQPEFLEMWAYPDGMSLKVPFYDPRIGGAYRFEHTGPDGHYVCNGFVKDFQPGSKLVTVDSATSPDGRVIFQNLETVTTFSEKPGGTFITVTIRNFPDEQMGKDCEMGWNQCFDRLDSLFNSREESASL